VTITTLPLDGRRSPSVTRRALPDWRPDPAGSDTMLSADELLCFVPAPEPTPPPAAPVFRGTAQAAPRGPTPLGDYLLVPRTQAPGRTAQDEKRLTIRPPRWAERRWLTLIRVPLAGGEVHRVALDGPNGACPIVGGALLWLDARNAPYDTVISRAGERTEYPASDDLMASPLNGGPAWRVASGIVAATVTSLTASEDGVFWKVPRHYPDRRRDLHFLTAADIAAHRPPRIVLDYASDQPPAVFQGRLYWIERRPREDQAFAPWLSWYSLSPSGAGSLICARLDGSDRRVLPVGGQEQRLSLQGLWLDRTWNRLYALGTSAVARP